MESCLSGEGVVTVSQEVRAHVVSRRTRPVSISVPNVWGVGKVVVVVLLLMVATKRADIVRLRNHITHAMVHLPILQVKQKGMELGDGI